VQNVDESSCNVRKYQIAAGKQPSLERFPIALRIPPARCKYLLNEVIFTSQHESLANGFGPLDALPADRKRIAATVDRHVTAKTSATSGQFRTRRFRLHLHRRDERIALPEGAGLNLSLGSSLNLTASEIDIGGIISAPGGSVSLKALNTGAGGSR